MKEGDILGFLDAIFKRNSELGFMFDVDLFQEKGKKVYMKKLAIDTCINLISRTISQSEFRVKDKDAFIKDELYYRLNVQPNKNMNASMFWQTVIYKLIYDNECLVVQADDGDLLIADDFTKDEFAVYETIFKNVIVDDFEFSRSFTMSNVFYLEYNNRSLIPLIDELFTDYGDLIGSIFSGQKRKNQIRSTVKIDASGSNLEKAREDLQTFIDKIYSSIKNNDIAVVPEQKGFEYKEHTGQRATGGQSVDEINKVTDGFMDKVAMAMGIPLGLLHGDMADSEEQKKNFMTFTVGSFNKKIQDEANSKFFDMKEYLGGKRVVVRKLFTKDIFELATSIDKLVSSGAFNGDEIRTETGYDITGEEIHKKYFITKNYQESEQAIKGGENE